MPPYPVMVILKTAFSYLFDKKTQMSLACTCIPTWQEQNIQHESIQTVPNLPTAIVLTDNTHTDQHKLSIHAHTRAHVYQYQITKGKSVLHNAAQKIMLFALHKAHLQALHKSSLEVSSRHKRVQLCQWAQNCLLWYQHVWRSYKINSQCYAYKNTHLSTRHFPDQHYVPALNGQSELLGRTSDIGTKVHHSQDCRECFQSKSK